MIRAFLAALILCAVSSCGMNPAFAKQKHVACIETGSIINPVCGMVKDNNPFSGARSISVTMRKVAPRARRYGSVRPVRPVMAAGPGIVRSASGAVAHVAASATGAFQCLVTALEGQGYPIRFMGGWRAHGSVRGSLHPAGLALDVNQISRNVTTPRMPGNEVALANGCGLISGAQWANGDSGHFQLGGWAGNGRTRYASRRHRHTRYASAR